MTGNKSVTLTGGCAAVRCHLWPCHNFWCGQSFMEAKCLWKPSGMTMTIRQITILIYSWKFKWFSAHRFSNFLFHPLLLGNPWSGCLGGSWLKPRLGAMLIAYWSTREAGQAWLASFSESILVYHLDILFYQLNMLFLLIQWLKLAKFNILIHQLFESHIHSLRVCKSFNINPNINIPLFSECIPAKPRYTR